MEFKVSQEATGMRANEVCAVGGAPIVGLGQMGMMQEQMGAMGGGGMYGQPEIPAGPPTGPPQPGMARGTCKWFDCAKGFGFISPEDGTEDVFVHLSSILCRDPTNKSMMQGEFVEFSTFLTEEGRMKAKLVTGPG